MQPNRKRQAWNLRSGDFSKKSAHAAQDWRFQMFFEYLRISPSYALAVECGSQAKLTKALGDKAWAERVFQTRSDVGNVYETLYREWWLANGLKLFGIQTARPRTAAIAHLSHAHTDNELLDASQARLANYINEPFNQQGRPDSLLVSIPLGQKRTTIMRQLRKLLDDANTAPVFQPEALYVLENNKMRYRRLLAGLRLVYMRAARPDEELWRVAARAKISPTHNTLDPLGKKKDAKSAESRRMLTIMASRLLHDALIVAENAAQGIFPSMQPTSVKSFDSAELGERLKQISKWEKARKGELSAAEKRQKN